MKARHVHPLQSQRSNAYPKLIIRLITEDNGRKGTYGMLTIVFELSIRIGRFWPNTEVAANLTFTEEKMLKDRHRRPEITRPQLTVVRGWEAPLLNFR